jgi:uncharacterized membrane protein YdjX (TVP38/TMEM64 family)
MRMQERVKKIWYYRDFIFIILGIMIAIVILRSNEIQAFIKTLGSYEYIGIFIAGMFFSSGFTIAPASSIIFISSKTLNPFLVAVIGALGAVFTDYLMLRFFKKCRNCFYEKCKECILIKFREISKHHQFNPNLNKIIYRFFQKSFDKISALIAGLIFASPLPDELGAIFCTSIKINTKRFMIIAFIFKMIGILAIALLARIL